MDGATKLKASLETLPQELRDLIYEHTFTSGKHTYTISENYKPPLLLQIDRKSRQMYASSFYGSCSFYVIGGPDPCIKWLTSLPQAHLDVITRDNSVQIEVVATSRNPLYQGFLEGHILGIVGRDLERKGVRLREGVLSIEFDQ